LAPLLDQSFWDGLVEFSDPDRFRPDMLEALANCFASVRSSRCSVSRSRREWWTLFARSLLLAARAA